MIDLKNTPVLFLLFNRPDTAEQVFEAIARAKPRQLFIAADGPRLGKDGDAAKCQAAREVIKRINWDCEVKTLFRDENRGCKRAVSSAIGWFFEHVESGIILEDDCLPSDSFFPFCGELLEKYRDDERVMMISGNNFQNGISRGDASYYFSSVPWIWGWATWRRAWALYDVEMQTFPSFVKGGCMQSLSHDKAVQNYRWAHFIPTYEGKINTWDYQWIYAILSNHGLSICPQVNLVSNIGFNFQGTHTQNENSRFANIPVSEIENIKHPQMIFPDGLADAYFYDQYLNIHFRKIKNRFRRWQKVWRKNQKCKKLVRRFENDLAEKGEL